MQAFSTKVRPSVFFGEAKIGRCLEVTTYAMSLLKIETAAY